MPQSNAAQVTAGTGLGSSISSGNIINGNLIVNGSSIIPHTTNAVFKHYDIELTRDDFKDLITLVRMIRDLPEEHELKREFRMQQAVDRLRGNNEDSSNS